MDFVCAMKDFGSLSHSKLFGGGKNNMPFNQS